MSPRWRPAGHLGAVSQGQFQLDHRDRIIQPELPLLLPISIPITAIPELSWVTWRAPRLWRPLPASPAGGAGARSDHPISGHERANFAVMHNAAFLIRTKASFGTPSTAKSFPSGPTTWLVVGGEMTTKEWR